MINQNNPHCSVCAVKTALRAVAKCAKERKQVNGHLHSRRQTPNQKDKMKCSSRILQSLRDPNQVNTFMLRPCCTRQGAKVVNKDQRIVLLVCHVSAEAASSCVSGSSFTSSCRVGIVALPLRAWLVVDTSASCTCRRIVVVVTSGLQDLHGERVGKTGGDRDVLGRDNGANDQAEEHDENDKVQNGVANNATLAQLGLFERVDGRANLTTWSEPEEHD